MSTENDTGDLPPDELRGDVRATAYPERGAAVQRLCALSDDELAAFVRRLDGALRQAQGGPADDELNDVVTIAANARNLLRNRRTRAAGDRAKAIVRELLSTGINE